MQQVIVNATTGQSEIVNFTPAPSEVLYGDSGFAKAGATVLVTYSNTFENAPADVTFDVNGATATVALTEGVAELEVTMPASGDVTVSVDRENVPAVTIRGV